MQSEAGLFERLAGLTAGGRAVAVTTLCIALFTAAFPFVRLEAIEYGHLSAFQDDFFYYLTIARNLAVSHQSTYAFVGVTNGYHPLWMGVLTVIACISDPQSLHFVILLQALVVVCILLSAWLFSLLMCEAFPDSVRARHAAGMLFIFLYANLTRTGMEVILTVPAMLAAMLACLRFWQSPSLGWVFTTAVLFSATILSRLDSALFVVTFIVACAVFQGGSRRSNVLRFLRDARVWLVASIGVAPVAIYLAVNFWVFGILLPQSSAAKQIRSSFGFNGRVFEFLFTLRPDPTEFVYFLLMGTLPSLLVMLALVTLPLQAKRMSSTGRTVVAGTAGFALLYYMLLAFATDWGMWIWYLYPAIVGGSVAAAGLLTLLPPLARAQQHLGTLVVPVFGAALVVVSALATMARNPATNNIHWAALRIAEFASVHPGVYAMGDRAGFAGFLLPFGLVQLEGLVSDPSLLELIRNNAPLDAAFRRFNVDYYITTEVHQSGGCYFTEEPKVDQAGTRSKRMTGRLCMPPVAQWTDRTGRSTTVFYVGP